jgi:hypothetical protein
MAPRTHADPVDSRSETRAAELVKPVAVLMIRGDPQICWGRFGP